METGGPVVCARRVLNARMMMVRRRRRGRRRRRALGERLA